MIRVLISGGWDIMHNNHVRTLRVAKLLGDYLIVNVVSDERMRFKKGKGRPLIPLDERMSILRELRCVDEVISIPGVEYPLFRAIELAKPDIVLINTDENSDISKEIAYCKQFGIKVQPIHRLDEGVSTTKLIDRLKKVK